MQKSIIIYQFNHILPVKISQDLSCRNSISLKSNLEKEEDSWKTRNNRMGFDKSKKLCDKEFKKNPLKDSREDITKLL